MPEKKDGYKMHMIVPKPTDPEKLKKREEILRRSREFPTEELKEALEGIQAKKEQEERLSSLSIILEKLGNFSNGGFVFNEGVERDDGNGKYIEIGGERYYEWSEGMNGLGYRSDLLGSGHYCLFCGKFKDGRILRGIQIFNSGEKYVGQFKNGVMDGEGTYTWPDGDKYVGQFKNDEREGQGTYTCVNGNILTGIWKDDSISEGKMKLKSDGTEIDVVRDRGKGLWKVTTEGEYKDKYIEYDTGEFIEP